MTGPQLRYRVVCTWKDDKGLAWSHTFGPFTERRDAYATFHAETGRRHDAMRGAQHRGCEGLVVELLDDEGSRPKLVERYPDGWAEAAG